MATKFEELFSLYGCDSITDEQVKQGNGTTAFCTFLRENNTTEVYKRLLQQHRPHFLKETDTERNKVNGGKME